MRLAIVDSDKDAMSRLSEIYESMGLVVDNYLYPQDHKMFLNISRSYDFILVEQMLGGTNGANVAHNLMKDCSVNARILMFSSDLNENYKDFIYYKKESELLEDPQLIFEIEDNLIHQAVETSVLMQMGGKHAS